MHHMLEKQRYKGQIAPLITSLDSFRICLLSEWPIMTQGIPKLTSISALSKQETGQFVTYYLLSKLHTSKSLTLETNTPNLSSKRTTSPNPTVLCRNMEIRPQQTFHVSKKHKGRAHNNLCNKKKSTAPSNIEELDGTLQVHSFALM